MLIFAAIFFTVLPLYVCLAMLVYKWFSKDKE